METKFEVSGTAIYRGKVKIAQCLDKNAGELFSENILPREEWRDLLPDYQQATANADTLVYRANHYHELRTKCERYDCIGWLYDIGQWLATAPAGAVAR